MSVELTWYSDALVKRDSGRSVQPFLVRWEAVFIFGSALILPGLQDKPRPSTGALIGA